MSAKDLARKAGKPNYMRPTRSPHRRAFDSTLALKPARMGHSVAVAEAEKCNVTVNIELPHNRLTESFYG